MAAAPKVNNSKCSWANLCDKKNKKSKLTNQKTIAKADQSQTNKKWYITAIVVGLLVLVGGGTFGCLGLLNIHHLPHWFTSVIQVVGNTPYHLSLWTIAGGSFVIGGGLTVFGCIKVHAAKKEDAKQRNAEQKRRDDERLMASQFDAENFSQLGIQKSQYDLLPANSYCRRMFTATRQQFVVMKAPDGTLRCTGKITEIQSEEAALWLETKGMHAFDLDAEQKKIDNDFITRTFTLANLRDLKIDSQNYAALQPGRYNSRYFTEEPEDTARNFILFNQNGVVLCSGRLTNDQRADLIQWLNAGNYLGQAI
jgi:hypothetical protein